jgi:hypothetical protein
MHESKRTRMTTMMKRRQPANLLLFANRERAGVVAPAWHLGTWCGQMIYHIKKTPVSLLTNGPDATKSLILTSLTLTAQEAAE